MFSVEKPRKEQKIMTCYKPLSSVSSNLNIKLNKEIFTFKKY